MGSTPPGITTTLGKTQIQQNVNKTWGFLVLLKHRSGLVPKSKIGSLTLMLPEIPMGMRTLRALDELI